MRWSVLVDPAGRSGAENMAIDEELLRRAQSGEGFFRLYRWSPPCLSFGRHEPAAARYDRAAIERLGIDVVRRPTGGRAVWHDAEVTYAVAAPVTLFGSLRETYIAIHEALAEGLCRLGIAAALGAPSRTEHGAGACFSSTAGGEVVVGGRKLVGSAQLRHHGAFLQHGSILLRDEQHVVLSLLRRPVRELRVTSLTVELGRPVGFDEVVNALLDAARAHWRGTWNGRPVALDDVDTTRFRDQRWTWRR